MSYGTFAYIDDEEIAYFHKSKRPIIAVLLGMPDTEFHYDVIIGINKLKIIWIQLSRIDSYLLGDGIPLDDIETDALEAARYADPNSVDALEYEFIDKCISRIKDTIIIRIVG
jgi:hypothetical protein